MRPHRVLSILVVALGSIGFGGVGAEEALAERWINAAEVNLRSEPGVRGAVLALLPLATPVRWVGASEGSGFCAVDAAGLRGFVACRFLSASAPTVPSRGSADGASGARWVTGAGVVLRAEPRVTSAIVARLALNARVELLALAGDSAYCEVAAGVPGAASAHGYTACRYLAVAPLAVTQIVTPLLADGQANPGYDPVRAFWLAPSWQRLQAYGLHLGEALKARTGTPPEQATPPERPADAEFERMKAHLGQGIYGPAPAPLPRWDDVRRLARTAATPPPGADVAAARRDRIEHARADARSRLGSVLRLGGAPFEEGEAGGARLAALASALDLPAVQPSLFRSASELAPPGESVEGLSGRFHIVHSYRTRGRDLGADLGTVDGLWDIGRVTIALTQPVLRTTLSRDGGLRTTSVRPSETRVLWGNADGPECEGYVDGFAFGAADPRLWRYFGGEGEPDPEALERNPPGTLLSFATSRAMPMAAAAPVVSSHALDRERTGFVAGTWLRFDLDGDGVFDLAVWEGTGRGPGHLDGPTKTDDPYYRLFLANIGGRWHVLGADAFGYGCGC